MARTNEEIKELIEDFRALVRGAIDASCPMHNREFRNAFYTGKKYLGEDVIQLEKEEEFKTLPESKKKEVEKQRNFGEYGIFYHGAKDETRYGLKTLAVLAAREILSLTNQEMETAFSAMEQFEAENTLEEIFQNTHYSDHDLKVLQDPDFIESIVTTFPEGKITKGKIQQAMKI